MTRFKIVAQRGISRPINYYVYRRVCKWFWVNVNWYPDFLSAENHVKQMQRASQEIGKTTYYD